EDASFIPKSGKKTYGLDKFYNSVVSRPERGLEISALAVIDVTQKGAYIAAVEQTPPTPELKKEQADATRLDHAIKQMQTARPHLPTVVSAKRDARAAKRFFRKMLKAPKHQSPRVINVDQNKAYPPAVEELKEEGVLSVAAQLRQCKYLNNIVEQDHRFIKRRVNPGLGFSSFNTARRTISGYEAMN